MRLWPQESFLRSMPGWFQLHVEDAVLEDLSDLFPEGRPDHGAGGEGVLALNDLNEELDYALIETAEREAICELIQTAAVDCGLQDVPDDVTEDWREW